MYTNGANWASYVQVDGKLVTGQNPASSGPAAEELLKLLRSACVNRCDRKVPEEMEPTAFSSQRAIMPIAKTFHNPKGRCLLTFAFPTITSQWRSHEVGIAVGRLDEGQPGVCWEAR